MEKDALTAEIKNRRATGRKLPVDLRKEDDVLRAALDADDLENGEFPSAAEPEPALAGSGNLTPKEEPASKLPPVSPSAVEGVPSAKSGKRHLRNQISQTAEAPESVPTQPSEEEWAGGEHHRHKGDGLTYEVVKRDADAFNKPFKARVPKQESGHPGLYWEGSQEEFDATFTKV